MGSDPFAAAAASDLPDDPTVHAILEGAEVIEAVHHPTFGQALRCSAALIIGPWTFRRGDTVTAYRGESDLAPVVGRAKLTRVRLNGQDVQAVNVGTTGAEGDVTVDLYLDPPVAAEVGDTLTFDRPSTTTRL